MKSRSWKLVAGIALVAALAVLVGLTVHLVRSANAADRELAELRKEVARQERDVASRQADLVAPITAQINDLSGKVKQQAQTVDDIAELGDRVSKLEEEAAAQAAAQTPSEPATPPPVPSTGEVPASQTAASTSSQPAAPVAEQPQPTTPAVTVAEAPAPAESAKAAEPPLAPIAEESTPEPSTAVAPAETATAAEAEPEVALAEPEPAEEGIESGRFVILQAGIPIGAETFTLRQEADGYTLTSTLRRSDGLLGTELSQTVRLNADMYPTRYSILGTQNGAERDVTAEFDGDRVVAALFGTTVLEDVVQSGSVVAALDPLFPSCSILLERALGGRVGDSPVEGTAFSGIAASIARLHLEPVEVVTLSVSGKDDAGVVQKVSLGGESMRYYVQNDVVVGFAIPSQEVFAYREDVFPKGFLVFPRTVMEMGMPVGVREEPMSLTNRGAKLAGTFAISSSAAANVKMALVLLLPDIGPFNREGDAVGLETRTLRDIARRLAQQGIASYRFDPRGVGSSEGDFASVSLSTLESDALIALIWLRANPMIDPEKIYVVGIGAGGIVALRLAAGGMATGAGILATPASSLGVNWIERLRHRASVDGLSPEDTEALVERERSFFDFVRKSTGTWNDVGLTEAQAALPWMNDMEYARRTSGIPLPLLRDLLDANPLDAVRAVRGRLFVLEGTKDFDVPASDADLFATTAKEGGNQSVTTAVVENINHLLRAQPEDASSLDRHIATEVDWGVLQPLLTWMGGPIIPTGGPGPLSPAS